MTVVWTVAQREVATTRAMLCSSGVLSGIRMEGGCETVTRKRQQPKLQKSEAEGLRKALGGSLRLQLQLLACVCASQGDARRCAELCVSYMRSGIVCLELECGACARGRLSERRE